MKHTAINVRYKDWDCKLSIGYYGNNRTALVLLDSSRNEFEPVAKATVNIPDEPLGADEVIIHDYDWYKGMAQALIDAGVIEPERLRTVATGFVTCPVHKLTPTVLETVLAEGGY